MNNKNFAEYKQQDLIEFVNEALGGVVLEERGMMPFIEELMVEMEEKIFNQLNIEKEQSYSLDSFSYIPSKSSFFKKCVFWKGSKIRIDNKVLAPSIKAYIHPLKTLYSEGILTIYINILTNKEDMQFAFRSALSHELLYAYIQLQGGKRLPKLEMDKRRVLEMMHSEDIFCKNIGWFLYFEMPHAKDDYNERIQKTTKNNREIFGQGYSTYSFDEIKLNIVFYRQLLLLYNTVKKLWKKDKKKCIDCFLYALGKKFKKREHWNKPFKVLRDYIWFDIEQTFDKALCRAIENDWLDRQNLLF